VSEAASGPQGCTTSRRDQTAGVDGVRTQWVGCTVRGMERVDGETLVSLMPFAQAIGAEIESATADEVRGGFGWAPERCTTGEVVHGGAIMALADSLAAVCAYLNLPDGAVTSTIESKTNFFRGLRSGRASATSTPLHVGRTTIVVQTDVRDDRGQRLALVTQTQAVIPK
jgi:1,4-dihydroxy-2-naphthoyl-CoA hydrolase